MQRFTVALALIAAFGLATGVEAQDADADVRAELQTMVAEDGSTQADRAAVSDFLERDDVQQVAAENGIGMERLEGAVETLDGEQAATLAERVREVQAQLAGGDTLVISATTLIIVLLVLILIQV